MFRFIYEGAVKKKLNFFIPCHGNIHCATFSLSQRDFDLNNVSIVAGHFAWDIWRQLPSFRDRSKEDQPSCLVIGRHPIERIISYYYQRCYQSPTCLGRNRTLNEISVDELSSLIQTARESVLASDNVTTVISDEGMMDAACRTMTNKRLSSGRIVGVDDMSLPDSLTQSDQEFALHNIEKCIIGIVEDWNTTLLIIHHFFPWIEFSHDRERRKMSLVEGKESIFSIRPDLAKVIVENNPCDMMLHQRMVEIFEREKKFLQLVTDMSSS